MAKVDARKLFKDAYTAAAQPKLVQVPPLTYFMMDGQGDPNSSPGAGREVEDDPPPSVPGERVT